MTNLSENLRKLASAHQQMHKALTEIQTALDSLKDDGLPDHLYDAIDAHMVNVRRPMDSVSSSITAVDRYIVSPRPAPSKDTRPVTPLKPTIRRVRLRQKEYERQDDIVAAGMEQMVPGQKFRAATFANAIAKKSHMTAEQVKRRLQNKALQQEVRFVRIGKGWYQKS